MKKKTVTTVVGLTIVGSCFLGSGSYYIMHQDENKAKSKFTYVFDEDGEIEATGRVTYKEVTTSWRLLEKKLQTGSSKLFIADDRFFNYIDVENGKKVASGLSGDTVLNVEDLEEYIIAYDMVKENYGISDIEELLSKIEQDYEYSYEKELVKE